ncbi:uncharacterized protein LOC117322188 [Pecten maximus]|uniref:uncharacterized protein LOC117322188 n=1 Tax=Pecten maximus TaxID=6579 RepID=UPI001457FC0E|nr:uncharacterized protein LOC117322188 [Pecten maximus]
MPPTRPSRKAKERHALVRPGRRQRATNISEDIEEQVTIVGNSPNQDTASASSALIALPPSPAIPGVSELAAEMLRQMKADGLIMRSANLMGPTVPVPATSTAPQTHTTPQATMSHSSTAREGLTSVERPEQVGVAISDVNSSTFATEAISSLTGTPALNSNNFSMNSISRPLDVNVDIRLKQKIWAEQFVEFGALVQVKHNETYELTMEANNLALVPKSRPVPIRTMDQWNAAFQVFVTIVVQGKPELAAPLMKYAHIVQHIAKKAGDQAAIVYDSNFRKWRQANPHLLPYEQANTELYLEAMTSQAAFGARSNKGYTKSQNQSQSGSSTQQHMVCYAFQKKGSCNRANCWFKHACRDCGGNHSFRKCQQHTNKGDSTTSTNQSPTNSSGGKPKSTHNK